MARPLDPEKKRRVREELDRLLENTLPQRNKKEYRAAISTQREADLSYRIEDTGIAQRISELIDSLSLDSKVEEPSPNASGSHLGSADSADFPETVAPAGGKKSDRLSFLVERLSDWRYALHRLAFVVMNSGEQAEVHADSRPKRANGRKQTSSHYFTWKQDDMQLTLSCLSKKPYAVTLHVDEGADEELSELCWIDEDSLCGNPDEPIEPKKFALERINDERTYKVDMRLGVFNGRMGSLNAACERESEDSIDLMLLLPFVN